MQAPVFSVIMPTHYRPDVIPFAIGSVLRQTEADFELLVVGDGAQLGTAEAVQQFSDPRVKWLDYAKAPGFGYANRNLALAGAKGRYIALMADDDLIVPDHLSRLRRLLDEGAVLACTRAAWVSSEGTVVPLPTSLGARDEFEHFMTRGNILPASCFAYRKAAITDGQHFPVDAPVAGDWLLWRRVLTENPHQPLAVDPTYTVLHFEATRSGHSRMKELRLLLNVADTAEWWPTLLGPPVSTSQSVQATWAQACQTMAQVEAVRAALSSVVDRLAWEAVQSAMFAHRRRLRLSPLNRWAVFWAQVFGRFR